MDQLLSSEKKVNLIDTDTPVQTRFYINQGMNYVYENNVAPYNKLLLKLYIKDNKLYAEKKSVYGIVGNVKDENILSFSDIVHIVTLNDSASEFEFPKAIITEDEREFFEAWKQFNNMQGNEKKLWRERT